MSDRYPASRRETAERSETAEGRGGQGGDGEVPGEPGKSDIEAVAVNVTATTVLTVGKPEGDAGFYRVDVGE